MGTGGAWAGQAALTDRAQAQWHQCEGTCFVGIDALANDARGAVAGVPMAGAPGRMIACVRPLLARISDWLVGP